MRAIDGLDVSSVHTLAHLRIRQVLYAKLLYFLSMGR